MNVLRRVSNKRNRLLECWGSRLTELILADRVFRFDPSQVIGTFNDIPDFPILSPF